jgi:serine protease Do
VTNRAVLGALALLLAIAAAGETRPWSWLGVRIRDLSEQEMEEIASRHGIREGFGVMIVEVLEDTPAARAGIRNGDVVVAFDGRPVTETRLLQRLIAAAPIGKDSRLTVLRTEGRRQMTVRLATMPTEVAGDRVAAEFGFVLRETVPGEPGGLAGAVAAVAAVVRGSAAEKAGLLVGDVLVQVGDRAVLSRQAAREALADAVLDRPLALTVRRGESRLALTVSPP